ncbi:hypothetical protein STCU_11438 [Strigomonas culicis]|uniref:Uncharacterized protein n=1 Tax=Strigomonas culicis TaxID=28005 RepID=S9UNL6_9TRYP|nr:hypothetical protein STCU_11438 [Strigomonas culicis]|eukprot:EPY16271.1 hypothetical protein STCU_11438 [Strigomonas culicis]
MAACTAAQQYIHHLRQQLENEKVEGNRAMRERVQGELDGARRDQQTFQEEMLRGVPRVLRGADQAKKERLWSGKLEAAHANRTDRERQQAELREYRQRAEEADHERQQTLRQTVVGAGATTVNFMSQVQQWDATFVSPLQTSIEASHTVDHEEWLKQLQRERAERNTNLVQHMRTDLSASCGRAREGAHDQHAKSVEAEKLAKQQNAARREHLQEGEHAYKLQLYDANRNQLQRLKGLKLEQEEMRHTFAERQRRKEKEDEKAMEALEDEYLSYLRENALASPLPGVPCRRDSGWLLFHTNRHVGDVATYSSSCFT